MASVCGASADPHAVPAGHPILSDGRLLADPGLNPFVAVGDDRVLHATLDEVEAWLATRPTPPAVVGVVAAEAPADGLGA